VLKSDVPLRWPDGPVVYATSDRVLRIDGRGGRAWLQSLLTTDLRSPCGGAARYALLLTPSGGIVTDAWVVERPSGDTEAFALVLPAALAERVHASLLRYLLNEDVEVVLDDQLRVITVQGRGAEELLTAVDGTVRRYTCPRLGAGGADVWVARSEVGRTLDRLSAAARSRGGGPVADDLWHARAVELGVPRAGVDFDERTSPHEAGLATRAVSLSKGCYLGQERVARQQRGADLARRLVQFEAPGARAVAEGSTVHDGSGAQVGRVTSVAHPMLDGAAALALGYVPPNLARPDARVMLGEVAARVRRVVGYVEAAGARTG
jgi:folate-binding protein YgfZ